jgi:2Fe-2S ferredoxin
VPLVTFVPSGRAASVESGATVLSAARLAGLPLASSCRGVGICDACKVRVVAGADALSAADERERGTTLESDERLACQARVAGAVTVTTTYW